MQSDEGKNMEVLLCSWFLQGFLAISLLPTVFEFIGLDQNWSALICVHVEWGCSSVGNALDQHSLCWSRFSTLLWQGIFFLEWTFNADSLRASTPICAIACINICAHDLVVCVRIWWIIETLKHPACAVGWVVQLSQLAFPGESNPNFLWGKF